LLFQLDLAILGEKPDLDQVLIDLMMYEDDELMSAALRLFDTSFAQRNKLRAALFEVSGRYLKKNETPNILTTVYALGNATWAHEAPRLRRYSRAKGRYH
jgi:hypothetical protein